MRATLHFRSSPIDASRISPLIGRSFDAGAGALRVTGGATVQDGFEVGVEVGEPPPDFVPLSYLILEAIAESAPVEVRAIGLSTAAEYLAVDATFN